MIFELDPKELKERQKAVDALVKEDQSHFVRYADECRRESRDGNIEIRKIWSDAWEAYQNNAPARDREDWQSDVVVPKVFSTVQQAKSIIRKALISGGKFYELAAEDSIKSDEQFKKLLEVGSDVFEAFQNEQHGKFLTKYVDAAEMSFVTGQSMEMIPRWQGGQLIWDLVEPWKISRDPAAQCREPQSGNYWIHEEWVDYWVLKELEKRKIIENIEKISGSNDSRGKDDEDESEESRRRQQVYERNEFIKAYLVKEFYGVIVDKKGELLLPNGKFVTCAGQLIKKPTVAPSRNYRFPGVSFSPIPHILRFEGRGIIEGVLKLWYLINNLLNLHVDNLNWKVNPLRQLLPSALLDPSDLEIFPGKVVVGREGFEGDLLKVIDSPGTTPEVLANANHFERLWQNSSFVNEFLEGLPGSRTEITKGEVEIKTEQSLGVFTSMAKDLEVGAVQALMMSFDLISRRLTPDNQILKDVLAPHQKDNPKVLEEIMSNKDRLFKHAALTVNGVTNLIKRMDTIRRIEAAMMKAESPVFGRYIKGLQLLKVYSDILGLDKYDWIVDEEAGKTADQEFGELQKVMMAERMMGGMGRGGSTGAMRNLPDVGGP